MFKISTIAHEGAGRVAALRHALRRSRFVHDRARFVAREMRKSGGEASYRLRSPRATVILRHHLIDAFLLDEVLGDRVYDPPREVAAVLGSPAAIVDLGANIGLATTWFIGRYPEAKITAFEPDPSNLQVLEGLIAANRWDERVRVIAACAGVSDGEVRFQASASPLSRQADDGPLVLQCVDAFPELARADLIKMDIEGAEWPILADERLASIRARALVLEYHPAAHLDKPPFAEARYWLQRAGFEVLAHHPQMLWAWRPDVQA